MDTPATLTPIAYHCAMYSVACCNEADYDGARVWAWLMDAALALHL